VLLSGQGLVTSAALGLTAVSLLARRRHDRANRPANLLQQSATLWGAALLSWAAVWVTVEVLPGVV
jgi:hypothetical protein